MAETLRDALSHRVVVADGAMGTMLQAADLTLEDFQGLEGCNEILNVTRPDVVRGVHEAYLAAGADAVETNTFGANLANLGEYGIAGRIRELAEAGARLARQAADAYSTADRPRYVLGSVGPGTKLPTLGHVRFADLRDAYAEQVAGLVAGGVDAVLVETAQDLLQAKAALIGARRALRAAGRGEVLLLAQITIETTGTMLLGTETLAALVALDALGVDGVGLNCATGPGEMSEHLRTLAGAAPERLALTCMPNAGLPVLGPQGASYPLSATELADAHEVFTADFGLALVGGCCGTTPEHIRAVADRVGGRGVRPRHPTVEPAVTSLYQAVAVRQDASVLMVGERTNANGSKAFRDAMVAGDWDAVVGIARTATAEGAHLIDVCVDYVGRDGVADVREVVGRLATASTLPIMVDSTEPPVVEAALELLGGRSVVNSVNFEDGEGEGSRLARVMPVVREHGAAAVALCIDEAGQARTPADKVRIAERLIDTLTTRWGMRESDIWVDTLTFTLATGQEESRGDAAATIAAIRELKSRHPQVQTILGVSNVSFGLLPAARAVLNSVFLAECVDAGLDAAIVHPSRILPTARIPEEQRRVALDLVYDRRAPGYDPLTRFMELMSGDDVLRTDPVDRLAGLGVADRLRLRIVDGLRPGLEADLDEALQTRPALEIVNDVLLDGMRTVGELFGAGEMQLPFVLTSAEVMKAAVAYLEPHMERTDSRGKGTIVLATVRGDVHDIGKNLVDIILTNNGYTVVNLGIKQPVSAILAAAEEHRVDAVGMSGLLVKSTVVMRENLEEFNARGVRLPVLLGGAALTRAYVEHDLREVYGGEVFYARDAFEGLALMDALGARARGEGESPLLSAAPRRRRPVRTAVEDTGPGSGRSDVARDVPVPTPPFWGPRVVRGVRLADYAALLDERALFLGQWGLRGARSGGPSYEELVQSQGRPRLRAWLERLHAEHLLDAAVVYGYFPCASKGEDLIVYAGDGTDRQERARFTFPRQRRDRRLCLSDFFRDEDSGELDVVAFQVVTLGARVSEATAKLFAADAYRDYLELHGLSVQLTEALAELWHQRVRTELGIAGEDAPDLPALLDQGYRGSRYSFGYPACPNLEDQALLVELLHPEQVGVTLSEEFQLHPEQSTDALVLHHPEAKYFNAR